MNIANRLRMDSLVILSLAQFGKFFSHFAMRTIFILYLIEQLGYVESDALGINTFFFALMELGGVLGGVLADRYLGLKKTVLVGSLFLSLGYFGFLYEAALFFSMGLLATGSSFFSSNIMALVGNYEQKTAKGSAFTFFYVAQNMGALLSTLLCGVLCFRYGFHLAFTVGSYGMFLSCFLLFLYQKQLSEFENPIEEKVGCKKSAFLFFLVLSAALGLFYANRYLLPILPIVTLFVFLICIGRVFFDREKSFFAKKELVIFLFALIVFFGVEDQICSSLVLFSEKMTTHSLVGVSIPSTVVMVLNPVIIIFFGGVFAKRKGSFLLPFYLSAGAFGVLCFLCLVGGSFLFEGALAVTLLISFSEVLLAPYLFSQIAKSGGKNTSGLVMGLIPLGFSLSFQLSGLLSKMVVLGGNAASVSSYGIGFGKIAAFLLLAGMVMYVFTLKKPFLFENK